MENVYKTSSGGCYDDKVGIFNHSLHNFIVCKFGQNVWQDICEIADVNVYKFEGIVDANSLSSESDYEEMTSLMDAVERVFGEKKEKFQEDFGRYFFRMCLSRYENILTAIGGTFYDFLNNLDDIYNHLKSSKEFEELKSPSFFCIAQEDGSLFLYFVFERPGYEHFAVGMLKEASRLLFQLNCVIDIEKSSAADHCTIFRITDTKKRLTKQPSLRATQLSLLAKDSLIDTRTMDQVLPFHIIINSDFEMCQLGITLVRLIAPLFPTLGKKFDNYFEIVKPKVKLDFHDIIRQQNSPFVLQSKPVEMFPDTNGRLELKGEMTHLADVNCLWFVGVPIVGDLENLSGRGLYISDMPIHDATRNVIMISEQANAQDTLKKKLQEMTNRLQDASDVLEKEKQKTQKLLDEIFPRSVASRLMRGTPVPAVNMEHVSVLFSDIVGFTAICGSCKPEDVIEMLNDLYLKFDALCVHHDLYKVETVGDAYMVAGGLHKKCKEHAQRVTTMGLGMIAAAGESNAPDNSKLKIRVGIHSGSVVAGVVGTRMPRYCLFGNNVTLANQMESTSEAGKVHVSPSTFSLVSTHPEYRFYRRPRDAMPALMQKLYPGSSYFVYQRRPSSCGLWDSVETASTLKVNFMQSKRPISFLDPFGIGNSQSLSAPNSRRPSRNDTEFE